jgi:hypothetical protein
MVMSAVLAGAVVTGVSPAAAESSTCVATELRLPAGTPSNVHSNLATSDATGRYQIGTVHQFDGSSTTTVLWTAGEPQVLDPIPGQRSFAVDVNSRGTVLGFTENADGQSQPWLYSNGTYRKLAVPAGVASISVRALNDRGDVVGNGVDKAGSRSSVIIWPAAGKPRRLLADDSSSAADINEAGVVIGNVSTAAGTFGLVWKNWYTKGERVTGKDGASIWLRKLRGDWFVGIQHFDDGSTGGGLFTTLNRQVVSFPNILDGVNGSGDVAYSEGETTIVARQDGTQYAIDAVGYNTVSYLFERGSAYDAAGTREYGFGRAVLWSGCAN